MTVTELEVADGILAAVVRYGMTRLDVTRVPRLEVFEGRGVTVHPPDERDEDEMVERAHSVRRADIDAITVLKEAVSSHGFKLGDAKDGFIQLRRDDLPSTCNVYFLSKHDVPPYAIAQVSKRQLTVVVHADDSIGASYNSFAHALGVHVVRLRDLATINPAQLGPLAKTIEAVREAIPAPEAANIPTSPSDYEVGRVAEYSRTRHKDRHFERAVGDIVATVVSSTFRLGSTFTGLPVPDGVLLEGDDCAIYDAKSKKDDSYDLGPSDADQQSRYLAILDRLRARDGMVPRGVLLFAPHVDHETFVSQARKEFWSLIRTKGLKLLVVQATALERLHSLVTAEGSAFRHFFHTTDFWRALWDQEVPGLQGESDLSILFPTRGIQARLLDGDDLEMAWLAGIVRENTAAQAVGKALDPTSPGEHIAERVARPSMVRRFFSAIGEKNASLASIGEATGLSPNAVRYLVLQEENDRASPAEWGAHGVANISRLRAELRGS